MMCLKLTVWYCRNVAKLRTVMAWTVVWLPIVRYGSFGLEVGVEGYEMWHDVFERVCSLLVCLVWNAILAYAKEIFVASLYHGIELIYQLVIK